MTGLEDGPGGASGELDKGAVARLTWRVRPCPIRNACRRRPANRMLLRPATHGTRVGNRWVVWELPDQERRVIGDAVTGCGWRRFRAVSAEWRESKMEQSGNDLTAVVERVQRLERRARRLMRIGIPVLVLVGIIFLLLLLVAMPGMEISANRFVLVDPDGNPRGGMLFTDTGPTVILSDAQGTTRLSLKVAEDGPRINLVDASQNRGIRMGVTEDGQVIVLTDAEGMPRIALLVDEEAQSLSLFDARDTERLVLRMREDGGGLSLSDREGKSRVIVVVVEDEPLVAVLDADELPLWTAP